MCILESVSIQNAASHFPAEVSLLYYNMVPYPSGVGRLQDVQSLITII